MEFAYQRKVTLAFIAADPVDLEIRRSTRSETPSGGYRNTRPHVPNVAAQRFRLIPQSDKTEEVRTLSGRMALPKFVLLGEHDVDLEEGDVFEFAGVEYEIAQILDVHSQWPYEKKADVVVWENSGR